MVIKSENATKLMETLCELINEVYYNLNIETEDEALYLNQQMMLNELLMDSPKYFDGLAGISIYPSLVKAEINKKIVHSCIPSCEITYKNNDAISSSLEAGLKWRYKVIPYKSKEFNLCIYHLYHLLFKQSGLWTTYKSVQSGIQ